MELNENLVLHPVNSREADAHPVGNFFVKEAFRQKSDDFNLAHGERRMSVRPRQRSVGGAGDYGAMR